MLKLTEMKKRMESLDQKSLNIIESDTQTDQQIASNIKLKNDVASLSKELKAIK